MNVKIYSGKNIFSSDHKISLIAENICRYEVPYQVKSSLHQNNSTSINHQ